MHRYHVVIVIGLIAVAAATACGDRGSSTGGARTIDVTLTDAGCEPASIAASAEPTTFHVTNDDAGAFTEFEVLDGAKIVGEVENVTPGLDRSFSLTLKPGSYVTYCPGGKKEKGTLEVAEAGTGQTGDPAARQAAVGAYVAYVPRRAQRVHQTRRGGHLRHRTGIERGGSIGESLVA